MTDTVRDKILALVNSGTHHDPTPTRRVYFNNDEAMNCDAWWQDYFLSAEGRVRDLAKELLAEYDRS